ncbi:MAG TPA: PQQ-binding-like beta-propeller repeat protein [Bryobacteraceae bacterium]|nr:PQQ-binding-like beta-propeller repeat protein [Bryobacteraceae bacterium]
MKLRFSCAPVCAALLLASVGVLSAQDGAALYKKSCAPCHDAGVARAPSHESLHAMTPERVLAAMESGPMISMANRQSAAARRAIAEFITGKSFSHPMDILPSSAAMCTTPAPEFGDPSHGPEWNGWGQNLRNTRFQDAAHAGLRAADIPRLKVKWAFGFPATLDANAHPSIANGRIFIGSTAGIVYSLDAVSGCVRWYFKASGGVRSAISIGRIQTDSGPRYAAFFGDGVAFAYALDANSGKQIWKTKVEDFPVGHITGSPIFYKNRLYVPVASGEEGAGASPDYECCRFRGSMVALDASTGKQIWKTYTISELPHKTKKNKIGTQLWGPSGAPIWSSPAIDVQRNVLYATTGDNYSDPTSRMSDAFVAFDLDTGKILWSRQMTASDAYTAACRIPDTTNCPDSNGPDFDFSSGPILVTLANGKRELVAGQKSGLVHAIDPDNQGELLWSTRVGKGGTNGGVQWGSATDGTNVYVALADLGRVVVPYSLSTDVDPNKGGGMFALRLDTGKRVWYTPPASCDGRKRCSPAQSAAVTAIPGVVFSGSVDGHLRAYSTRDGSILWDMDTIAPYKTVDGIEGKGGAMDGPGPIIAGGMLFVNSGYSAGGGMPGNVLLAFSVDGK